MLRILWVQNTPLDAGDAVVATGAVPLALVRWEPAQTRSPCVGIGDDELDEFDGDFFNDADEVGGAATDEADFV